MLRKILPATQMRQNLKQVLGEVASGKSTYYITQRSFPKAVLTSPEEHNSLASQAAEAEQLRTALRWSLGFMANIGAAMAKGDNPAAYVALLEEAIREGLRQGHVPRGVIQTLEDVEPRLKEWDFRTFRVQHELRTLERMSDHTMLGRFCCPPMLESMRQQAPFHIQRIGWRDYRGAARKSVSDFLCLCCSLCVNLEVDWLSDGRFLVAEVPQAGDNRWPGVCAYAVRRRVSETASEVAGRKN